MHELTIPIDHVRTRLLASFGSDAPIFEYPGRPDDEVDWQIVYQVQQILDSLNDHGNEIVATRVLMSVLVSARGANIGAMAGPRTIAEAAELVHVALQGTSGTYAGGIVHQTTRQTVISLPSRSEVTKKLTQNVGGLYEMWVNRL